MAKTTVYITAGFLLALVLFISMSLETFPRLPIITTQGFVGGMFASNQNPPPPGAQQCGVDLPGCPEGKRCINGFCRGTDIPVLQDTSLRVVP